MKNIPQILFILTQLFLFEMSYSQNFKRKAYQTGKNRVEFKSNDIKIIGDLYLPPNFDTSKKYTAILFDGPSSGLKDQVVGLYAQKIAALGFVTLAYDHRFYGESEGLPRQFEAPSKKVEDNKNALNYLISLHFIDSKKVAGIGICSGGGIMSKSVAEDKRFKAYIGIAGYYNDVSNFIGKQHITDLINKGKESRLKFEKTNEVDYMPTVWSDSNEKKAAMSGLEPTNEPFAYYGTKRGYSPYYINRMAIQSYEDMLTFDVFSKATTISVPSLIIHGTKDLYCPVFGAQKFYDKLTTKKELYWIETTNHIDLYDQEVYVNNAVSKAIDFLSINLK